MSNKAIPLPMDLIRESLELDPTSPSHLRWKQRPRHHFKREQDWMRWNSCFAGKAIKAVSIVGGRKKYWRLAINDTSYCAHRIVYALANGTDPGKLHIDHTDGDGQNNAPSNLRLATNAENMCNRGVNRNSTTGVKGVFFDARRGKFYAQIKHHGRQHFLGSFDKKSDAESAYARAAAELHGDFAKTA